MPTSITNTSLTTDNLTVDTNTIHVDSTNNRVGIGTASPLSELHQDIGLNDREGHYLYYGADAKAGFTVLPVTGEIRIGAATAGTSGNYSTEIMSRNGSNLVTSIKADNYGRVTKPNQPAFHIQGTAAAHTAGNETAVYYVSTPTIKFNVGNHGVGGTASATSGKFTCPASGIYLVCCTWYRGGSATAYMGTIVKKNAASEYSYWYNNASNYGDASVGQTAMIQCSTNDVLQQYVYGNSSDADPSTTMQIYFLG